MSLRYREFRNCIIIISMLYIVGFFYGFYSFSMPMAKELSNPLSFNLATIVFNNLFVTLTTKLSGIFSLGLFPLYLTFNEAINLSTTLQIISYQENISVLRLFVLGILPHGVLEIPAYILSSSLGLYIGYRIMVNLRNFSFDLAKNKLKLSMIEYYNKISPLVVFAGLLEVILTPMLIINFL